MSVAVKTESFAFQLKELPKKMRIFSLCLRSLYAENAVGSSAYNATGINNIRDQTRQDAIVYVKGVLPLSTQVVSYAQTFFEYYEGLGLDEWKECLPDILEEVTGYQQCCTEVIRMHEEMIVPLKKRQDEATVLISGLHDINKELKKKKAQLEKEAATSEAWASGLCFVPIVGLIATPLLCKSADGDIAKAVAGGRQVSINEAAIVVVSDVLIPALSKFIDGLQTVAGFFNILKEEITIFQSRGNQAEPIRLHYIMMKRKAMEVNKSCRDFYAMIPAVRTDLQCIPEKPDDLKYFDKWLIKQHEVIKRKYNQTLTGKLKTLLKQCESIEGFEQLAI